MTGRFSDLSVLLSALRSALGPLEDAPRRMLALAGPPGAGKSTLVEALLAAFGDRAAVLPMDGFHLDNALLDARGDRARKGAPWTYDVAGLAADLHRLRQDAGPVLVPVFDRALDLSRASAREIGPQARLILVEGNYLLLGQAPWDALEPFWDITIALDVTEPVLKARLMQRWLDHDHSPAEAEARVEANDLPNARLVLSGSRAADFTLVNG